MSVNLQKVWTWEEYDAILSPLEEELLKDKNTLWIYSFLSLAGYTAFFLVSNGLNQKFEPGWATEGSAKTLMVLWNWITWYFVALWPVSDGFMRFGMNL